MAVRASDTVTLAVLLSPTYVRQYYLLQASALAVPAVPTTNPPTGTWSVTEPTYTAGSTDTLYTVMLTAYGSATFEYGPVQVSSSYDAAKQAYNRASTAITAAQTAQTTADGKNKMIFSTSVASGTAYIAGDIWFQKSGALIIAQWEFTTSWQARTLDNAVIGNLSAGKINAGSLSADRIAASTLSTKKLLVGNFNNLLEGPGFEENNPLVWNLATANVTNVTTTPRTGLRALRIKSSTIAYEASRHQNAIPVEEGESYVYAGWVRAEGTGAVIEGGIELSVMSGAVEATMTLSEAVGQSPAAAATYLFMSGIWTVPTGMKFARPRIVVQDIGNINVHLVDDLTFYKQVPGELIVDGAITAGKIGAEQIIGTHIQGLAIDGTHIQAETILTGHIGANQVTAVEILARTILADNIAIGAIETSHLSSTVGEELDISSNVAVTIIAGQMGDVQTDLNATSTSLEDMQTYYAFGPTGAIISTPASPFALALRSDRIEMLENGNPVSYWNSGQMNVNSLVAEELILGNHKIEKYLTGTVVKAL